MFGSARRRVVRTRRPNKGQRLRISSSRHPSVVYRGRIVVRKRREGTNFDGHEVSDDQDRNSIHSKNLKSQRLVGFHGAARQSPETLDQRLYPVQCFDFAFYLHDMEVGGFRRIASENRFGTSQFLI